MKMSFRLILVSIIVISSCIVYALPEVRKNYNPSNYTTPGEVVDPGTYDEEGHCIYARVVVEHAGLLRYEYQDRPDLAGQGMSKKKKKSAWKTFIEDNPKKYCDEEDVEEEKLKECKEWHNRKKAEIAKAEKEFNDLFNAQTKNMLLLDGALVLKNSTKAVITTGKKIVEKAGLLISLAVDCVAAQVENDWLDGSNTDIDVIGDKIQGEMIDATTSIPKRRAIAMANEQIKNSKRLGELEVLTKDSRSDLVRHERIVAQQNAQALRKRAIALEKLGKAVNVAQDVKDFGGIVVNAKDEIYSELDEANRRSAVGYMQILDIVNQKRMQKCPYCGRLP